MTVAPRRIAILGPTGAGKTTLGYRLSAIRGVPAVELDALFHQPNWQPTQREEFREKVSAALDEARDGWVCIGNYTSQVGDIVLPCADTVVWLLLPWRLTFWRLLKRTVKRAWTRELLWGTNRESWRKSFLDKESILWWSITQRRAHYVTMSERFKEVEFEAPIVKLRSDREVERFVASMHQGATAGD